MIPVLMSLVACSNCATVGPVVQREEAPFLACVPQAIPALIACHASPDEATCIVLQVTALVACWSQHAKAPATDGNGSGGSGVPVPHA